MTGPGPVRIALAGIACFIAAAVLGPLVSHPDYASVTHTVSQLAGQNMPNAWIMRTGFVAFGAATVLAALLRLPAQPAVSVALVLFGLAMVAAAVWSNLPIDPGLGGSAAEDRRHSIAASAMGVAFAAACVARFWTPGPNRLDPFNLLALACSVGLPMLMLGSPAIAGAAQRLMFLISFVWILRQMAGR